MADPQRITYPADNWTDRDGQPIIGIVVHGTGGGLKSSLSTLKTGDKRGVSIHVLIAQDGTQYVMLPGEKAANHAGAVSSSFTLNGKTYRGTAVNKATLGVELVNLQDGRDAYPKIQLQSLGWLINHWRSIHGPLPVLRHGDLDPTRRRDPYQLTVNQIEEAAAKVATNPPVSLPKRYRVRGLPVYEQSDRDGPLWGSLRQDEIIEIDDPKNGHLADGRGFIRFDPDTLEPVP